MPGHAEFNISSIQQVESIPCNGNCSKQQQQLACFAISRLKLKFISIEP